MLTADEPLGPLNFQNIHDHQGLYLIDVHGPFRRALQLTPRLLVGRKGTGKSTVLYASQFYDHLRVRLEREHVVDAAPRATLDDRHVITIKTYQHFDAIVQDVHRRAYGSSDPHEIHETHAPKSTEAITEDWEDRFWLEIFSYFWDLHRNAPEVYLKSQLENVLNFINRTARIRIIQDKITPGLSSKERAEEVLEIERKLRSLAKQDVVSLLKRRRERCFLLIDTLETYNLTDASWREVVSGFIPALELLHRNYENRISATTALPEELLHYFLSLPGSEPAKNFASEAKLKWKPKDLKRMLAHKFICLFNDICAADSIMRGLFNDYNVESFQRLQKNSAKMNLTSTKSVNRFFEYFLPTEITNGLGVTETCLSA